MIKQRVQKWEPSTITNLKSKSREHFVEIAKNYIVPFNYTEEELTKLVDFIEDSIKRNH